jgi:leucyl aminopeptidase
LVIDAATLTGAAHRAVGDYAICMMSNAEEKIKKPLHESGFEVQERIIEFPLWDEYGDMLKSDIADLKNVGGVNAGMITAAKFLERFTDYPWIHLDIAGIAYLSMAQGYQVKNASGFGIRLLYRFLKKRAEQK